MKSPEESLTPCMPGKRTSKVFFLNTEVTEGQGAYFEIILIQSRVGKMNGFRKTYAFES